MGFMIGPMVFQRGLKKPMWGLVCKDASSLCIEAGLVVIVAPLISLNIDSRRALEAQESS